MDSAVLRDAYVCIFNSLANLNVVEKKNKTKNMSPLVDMFLLD